ncbi:hypothetical protein IFM89_022411 [Coptis chinensis]|uniref:Uncharacterized protein n=1 Tax=Coptis chinensis TaxID=261450 RepID=A0A835LZ74_9MAGN|nr:hypothetical protein IFM89_022411 [Coptis chinensis]
MASSSASLNEKKDTLSSSASLNEKKDTLLILCFLLSVLTLLFITLKLPKKTTVIRKAIVIYKGHEVRNLNELEYVNGEVWANVWLGAEVPGRGMVRQSESKTRGQIIVVPGLGMVRRFESNTWGRRSPDAACTALALYVDVGDPDMAIKVWKCMLENEMMPGWEIGGNKLIVGLRDLNRLNRLPAARKYAEDIIEKGMKLHSKTLSKLKQSLTQLGKAYAYDELLRK